MAEKVDRTDEFLYCSCTSSRDNIEEYPELKAIVPSDFKYTVCSWKKVDENHFESKFRVNVANERNCRRWMHRFQESSGTRFHRTNTSLPKFKEAILMSLRCKEITPVNKPPEDAPRKKDINPADIKPILYFEKRCNTRLVAIVKLQDFSEVCNIPDVHLHEFPMTVIYHHLHNHPLPTSPQPMPSFVDEEMMPIQQRQILEELREVERSLQIKACREAGGDPDKILRTYDPFSLASFRDAISSVISKSKRSKGSETDSGCLLHSGDSYSKAWDLNSLGEYLYEKGRSRFFHPDGTLRMEGADPSSSSVTDVKVEKHDDIHPSKDNVAKYDRTPDFRDELKKPLEASSLKDASSEPDASSGSRSQFFPKSKPQTKGAVSVLTPDFDCGIPPFNYISHDFDLVYTDPEMKKKLERKRLEAVKAATSGDNASSESLSQFLPESKPQTEGATTASTSAFRDPKLLDDLLQRVNLETLYNDTQFFDEVSKRPEAPSLTDASSEDNASSESRSQSFPDFKPQTEGAATASTPIFDSYKFLSDLYSQSCHGVMYNDPEMEEELRKIVEAASLEDASEDTSSSESLSS